MFWLLLALLSLLWTATGFLVGLLLSLALIPLRKGLRRLPGLYRRLSRRLTHLASIPRPNPDAIHGVALVDDDADLDAWASAQVDDAYIELTRDYLTHCFSLDPAPHDHRNHS